LEERAKRRLKERKKDNPGLTLKEIKQSIAERDHKDSQRESDPLKIADDAIEIDTTNLTFEQQVDKICLKISEAIKEIE